MSWRPHSKGLALPTEFVRSWSEDLKEAPNTERPEHQMLGPLSF